MVFNWFRRQHNDSSNTPPEEQKPETSANEATEPAEAQATETVADTSADLLAFAKAAYKNIQQKQSSEPEPVLETSEKLISEESQLDPAPSTQHPVPSTQHPAPSTQHPAPSTQ
jgi:fused signal recognition particle receptor